jgi:hypothetical protein
MGLSDRPFDNGYRIVAVNRPGDYAGITVTVYSIPN